MQIQTSDGTLTLQLRGGPRTRVGFIWEGEDLEIGDWPESSMSVGTARGRRSTSPVTPTSACTDPAERSTSRKGRISPNRWAERSVTTTIDDFQRSFGLLCVSWFKPRELIRRWSCF